MCKTPGRTLNYSAYCISQFKRMNQLGKTSQPFFFMVDFELENPVVIPISELPEKDILFDIAGYRNFSMHQEKKIPIDLISHPISYDEYVKSFKVVNHHLHYGNSFLVNLTQKNQD
jgi:para-aminobenzoate synthetase component 1